MSFASFQQKNMLIRHMNPDGDWIWRRNPSWPAAYEPWADDVFTALIAIPPEGAVLAFKGTQISSNQAYVEWNYYNGVGYNNQYVASGIQAQMSYPWTETAYYHYYDSLVTFDTTTNTVQRTNHGYWEGDIISFADILNVNVTNVIPGMNYFVINVTDNSFQISTQPDASGILPSFGVGSGQGRILPYKMCYVSFTGPACKWLDFSVKSTTTPTQLNGYTSPIMELSIRCPSLNSLTLGSTTGQTQKWLESFNLIGTHALTSFANLFNTANTKGYNLRNVRIDKGAGVTSTSNMFNGCCNLRSVPYFDTSAVTDMTSMFNGCNLLERVPAYNMQSCTISSSMFYNCYLLERTFIKNASAITNASQMFQNCISLKSVDGLDFTSSSYNISNIFTGCVKLKRSTFKVAQNNPTSLNGPVYPVGLSNGLPSINATFIASPLTVTSATFGGIGQNIETFYYSLGTSTLTSVWGISTYFIPSIKRIYFNPSASGAATSASYLFYTGGNIQEIHGLNVSGVTSAANFSYTFNNMNDLQILEFAPGGAPKYSFSIANTRMSGAQLDAVFTALPTVATAQTITITGSIGAATCTRSIATSKNWVVTG